jgi:predicted RNA-binding Zn-ribbon protein involved in translation (DUF1610 family)
MFLKYNSIIWKDLTMENYDNNYFLYGELKEMLVCPHCGEKGFVRTKSVKQKKGVSGAKATGALLTGGLSILATGLSRKEKATQSHCTNCGSTWYY